MDLKAHIGGKVKKARRASGMTQEMLADALEKSGRTVSAIESGESLTSLATLEDIALKLHQPIAYFFEGYGQRANPESKTERAINELLSSLPPEKLDLALTLLKALKQHHAERLTHQR